MKKILLFCTIVSLVSLVNAETHLSGDIRGTSLDSTGNPYIVDQDVVIPGGKRLTIKEGCVLLFKGFTGMNVLGQLTVSGSPKRPVVFTSQNDGDYNPKSEQLPNPFDWNGILIGREASGAMLENFQLRYSVYGIKSQNTAVTIRNGIFRQNGQFHFTINDKIQYVQDNIAYSYSGSGTEPEKTSVTPKSGGGTKVTEESSELKTEKNNNTKTILRYTSLGVGVVGIIVGALFLSQRSQTLSNRDSPDYIKKQNPNDPNAEWNNLNTTASGQGTVAAIGFVIGGIGLAGFGLTFVF
jgi:hypothetical protein